MQASLSPHLFIEDIIGYLNPTNIYFLLYGLLSHPHTTEEAMFVYNKLVAKSNSNIDNKLDISRALAFACEETDPSLLRVMLQSSYYWNPNLSCYYRYLTPISLPVMLVCNKIYLDEATFAEVFLLDKPHLFRELLSNKHEMNCRGPIHLINSCQSSAELLKKYPITRVNKDIFVEVLLSRGYDLRIYSS